jgi:signal peptidase I
MRNSTKAFGVFCLSSSTGLFLYWIMFLISHFMRVQRFGIDVPNINFSTGVVGAVSVALFTLGIFSVRSKTCEKLVMVRNAGGKVCSILRSEYPSANRKPEQSMFDLESAMKAPKLRLHLKTRHILGIAALTAIVSGYALIGLTMGMFSPIMAVSSQSMTPTFNYGDLIVVRGEKAENVEVGDIIAFTVPAPFDRIAASPTVHRVVEKWVENDKTYFKTKGDSNPSADSWKLPAENIVGEYAQLKVPYVGSVAIFLKTPVGLALLNLAAASGLLYGYYKKKEKNEFGR